MQDISGFQGLLASAAPERCLTGVHVLVTVRGFEHMSQDTMSKAQYVLHSIDVLYMDGLIWAAGVCVKWNEMKWIGL